MDETSRHTPQSVIGAYKRSKLVAERVVERMIAEEGLPAVIVAPSTPIGPRDIKPTPTGRIIVEAATGRMPAFVDTGLNLVHVDDVAEGHFLALERGRIGENYILGGEDVTPGRPCWPTSRRWPGRKRAQSQTAARRRCFRWPMARKPLARITGKEPFLTADALRMSRYQHVLLLRQGRARTGLYGAALSRRA